MAGSKDDLSSRTRGARSDQCSWWPAPCLGALGARNRFKVFLRWLNDIADWMDMSLSKLWELAMDREAWRPTVHGVPKSWTRLSELNWTNLCPVNVGQCHPKCFLGISASEPPGLSLKCRCLGPKELNLNLQRRCLESGLNTHSRGFWCSKGEIPVFQPCSPRSGQDGIGDLTFLLFQPRPKLSCLS